MAFLNGCNETELGGKLGEAFLLCGLRESFIHICPLEVLSFSSGCEVLGCISYAVQLLEPEFGVLLLIVGGLQEKLGNLLETLFLGL